MIGAIPLATLGECVHGPLVSSSYQIFVGFRLGLGDYGLDEVMTDAHHYSPCVLCIAFCAYGQTRYLYKNVNVINYTCEWLLGCDMCSLGITAMRRARKAVEGLQV